MPDLTPCFEGSSDLVHQLLASDLVDELLLRVYPILRGRGKRLFDNRTQPAAFRLEASRATTTGALVNRPVRQGEVRTASLERD